MDAYTPTTSLYDAAESGDLERVQMLVEQGTDIEKSSDRPFSSGAVSCGTKSCEGSDL